MINGVCFGLLVGTISYIWRGQPILGLIAGMAMLANMIVAAIAGTVVPLFLKFIKADPALASGVIVTTLHRYHRRSRILWPGDDYDPLPDRRMNPRANQKSESCSPGSAGAMRKHEKAILQPIRRRARPAKAGGDSALDRRRYLRPQGVCVAAILWC